MAFPFQALPNKVEQIPQIDSYLFINTNEKNVDMTMSLELAETKALWDESKNYYDQYFIINNTKEKYHRATLSLLPGKPTLLTLMSKNVTKVHLAKEIKVTDSTDLLKYSAWAFIKSNLSRVIKVLLIILSISPLFSFVRIAYPHLKELFSEERE
jgi:hypothetical protein